MSAWASSMADRILSREFWCLSRSTFHVASFIYTSSSTCRRSPWLRGQDPWRRGAWTPMHSRIVLWDAPSHWRWTPDLPQRYRRVRWDSRTSPPNPSSKTSSWPWYVPSHGNLSFPSCLPFLYSTLIHVTPTNHAKKYTEPTPCALYPVMPVSVPSRNVTDIPILNFLPISCYDKESVHLSPTFSEPCPGSKTRLLLLRFYYFWRLIYALSCPITPLLHFLIIQAHSRRGQQERA